MGVKIVGRHHIIVVAFLCRGETRRWCRRDSSLTAQQTTESLTGCAGGKTKPHTDICTPVLCVLAAEAR